MPTSTCPLYIVKEARKQNQNELYIVNMAQKWSKERSFGIG